jgi:hypothetical protein
VETIVNALLGAALRVFGMGVSPAAAIVAVLVELVLGLALVISIVGQFFARVALLYIVVALAPLVLVLGIMRPARWLQGMWIKEPALSPPKGLLLVMLVGPITALLFKLILALHVAIVNPILSFLMVVGVTSVLLAVNGTIVKGIFGAAAEVVGRALETATGVVRGAATAVAAIGAAALSGGAALGVLPGALAGTGGGAAAAAGASVGGGSAGTVAAGLSAAGSTSRNTAGTAGGASARTSAARTGIAAAQAGPDPSAPLGVDSAEGPSAAGTTGGSAGSAVGTARAGANRTAAGERADTNAPGAGEGAGAAGEDSGFLGRLRRRWAGAAPQERAEAAGAALRAGGAVLGSRGLAGRVAGAAGAGLQAGARRQAEEGAAPAAGAATGRGAGTSPSGFNLTALSPDELRGYQEAMRDVRRDLRTPLQAAGLDLRQVERDALAPMWAAAQHDRLPNVARQAGFGDRGSAAIQVADFVAYRIEGQLMAQGFLSERITRPGSSPVVPLSDTPALMDYDRGQQIAWATRGGNMAAYAGLHYAIRRYADTPQAGLEAAGRFYEAAVENRSVAGVVQAAQEYGAPGRGARRTAGALAAGVAAGDIGGTMPYSISTPRRFDFETRVFGLALKQWACPEPVEWGYLSVGVAIAGLIGLGVLVPGLPLGVRIVLALAYLKYHGLPLDRAMLS